MGIISIMFGYLFFILSIILYSFADVGKISFFVKTNITFLNFFVNSIFNVNISVVYITNEVFGILSIIFK